MDKDLTALYALISTAFGFMFGVELGVAFFALAGSFVSVRFCETKTTSGQSVHVAISTFLACAIVGGTTKIYPDWISLKVVGLVYGFLILLLAEKLYTAIKETNVTEKLNKLLDKWVDTWTR